ncbi:PREDICTED: uncharacterized protein LOC109227940 [Nicotiana attenuata]|uniref:uncharacterized protein LOC109227940 n=1 Tax=Nicotiana attenuata TaxID=49451 RepID=UPI000904FD50|nr:PREDICTED: uncharacterized protein LOC109227940 [Nicotiana attenuata]
MESENSSSSFAIPPPVFDGENYQVWAIKMKTHMEACDLWDAVEEDYDIPALPGNPTMAQIKLHKEKRTRKFKAKSCLYAAISPTIFSRVMALESAKAIWDFLKEEYQGGERIKGMKVMNLIREFEMQRMKESKTVKEYSDRLLSIVNKVRMLGKNLPDSRVVEKILVTLSEKFEPTIASLENTKDLSQITLAEVLNALQAQEQRRLMREEGTVEGALQAKLQSNAGSRYKKGKGKKNHAGNNQVAANNGGGNNSSSNKGDKFPSCQHCRRKNHPHFKCWRKPDMRCRKCNKLGHAEIIYKSKDNQQETEA